MDDIDQMDAGQLQQFIAGMEAKKAAAQPAPTNDQIDAMSAPELQAFVGRMTQKKLDADPKLAESRQKAASLTEEEAFAHSFQGAPKGLIPYSGGERLAVGAVKNAIPFGSSIWGLKPRMNYEEAKQAIADGTANQRAYDTVAAYERLTQAEGSRSTGQAVTRGLAGLPAMIGETMATAGFLPGGGKGASALMKYGVRNAASTALSPSMYVPAAEHRAREQGGEVYDPKNLAPAYLEGLVTNAIMSGGSNAGKSAIGKVPTLFARTGVRTAKSMAEQQAADVVTSLVDELHDEKDWKFKTGYGLIGEMAKKDGHPLQRAAVQAATFYVANGIHGLQGEERAAPVQRLKEAADALHEAGVPAEQAAKILADAQHGLEPPLPKEAAEKVAEAGRTAGEVEARQNAPNAPESTQPATPPGPSFTADERAMLERSLGGRLDALPKETRDALLAATVAGREAPTGPQKIEPTTEFNGPEKAADAFRKVFEGATGRGGTLSARFGDTNVFLEHNHDTGAVRLYFTDAAGRPILGEGKEAGVSQQLRPGSVTFLRKMRDFVAQMKEAGQDVEYTAKGPQRADLYRKVMERAGFTLAESRPDEAAPYYRWSAKPIEQTKPVQSVQSADDPFAALAKHGILKAEPKPAEGDQVRNLGLEKPPAEGPKGPTTDLFGTPQPKTFGRIRGNQQSAFGGNPEISGSSGAWMDRAKEFAEAKGLEFEGFKAGNKLLAGGKVYEGKQDAKGEWHFEEEGKPVEHPPFPEEAEQEHARADRQHYMEGEEYQRLQFEVQAANAMRDRGISEQEIRRQLADSRESQERSAKAVDEAREQQAREDYRQWQASQPRPTPQGPRTLHQMSEWISKADLTERERDILTRRANGETQESIGTRHQITREWVRRLEAAALKRGGFPHASMKDWLTDTGKPDSETVPLSKGGQRVAKPELEPPADSNVPIDEVRKTIEWMKANPPSDPAELREHHETIARMEQELQGHAQHERLVSQLKPDGPASLRRAFANGVHKGSTPGPADAQGPAAAPGENAAVQGQPEAAGVGPQPAANPPTQPGGSAAGGNKLTPREQYVRQRRGGGPQAGERLAGDLEAGPAAASFGPEDFGDAAEPVGAKSADSNPAEFGQPLSAAERERGLVGGGQPGIAGAERRTPERLTALANEVTAKEREANRLPEIASAARRGNEAVWDSARQRIQQDPELPRRLIDDLERSPRPASVDDDAVLLQHRIGLSNEYQRTIRDLLAASPKLNPQSTASKADLEALDAREQDLLKQIDRLDKVIVATGTEQGRALQFRRQLAREDYSLDRMLQSAQAAKGERLTHEEIAEIAKLSQRIGELEKSLADAEAKVPGQGANSAAYRDWLKQRAASETAKTQFSRQIADWRKSNDPIMRRVESWWDKYRRFGILTGPRALWKIGSAGLESIAINPIYEAAGAAYSRLPGLSKIAALAPREGKGFDPKIEAKAFMSAFTEGFKDAWQTAWTGRSDLDVVHKGEQESRGGLSSLRAVLDWPGVLHAALKAPAKRAEYTRSFLQRLDFYGRQGQDITAPGVLMKAGYEAYADSNRAIFREDNALAASVQKMIGVNPKDSAGMATLRAVGRTALPVVKVPTNVVAQAIENITGSITGSVRAGLAFRKGVETLTPQQADLIMRQLKRGSIGAAVFALGMMAPGSFGGFYDRNDKKRKLEPMSIDTPAGNVPGSWLHHPLFYAAQAGASLRRTFDKTKGDTEAASENALLNTAGELVDETPMGREMFALGRDMDAKDKGRSFGEFAKSLAIPQLSQWLAGEVDKKEPFSPSEKPTRRYPAGVGQSLQTGIPWARQEVPSRPKKVGR